MSTAASGDGSPVSQGPSSGLRRYRAPIAVVVLGAALFAGVELWPDVEGGHRTLAALADVGLTFLLLSFWLWFFSGLSRRARLLCFVAELAPVLLLRVEGFSGDLQPKLSWRFSRKKDVALAEKLSSAPIAGGRLPADLAKTTPNDFPQFLGPARNEHVPSVRLARDWSQPPRCLWRQSIGAGWSGFAVVGNFAVTQEQRGDEELVVCYELLTGQICWSHGDRTRFSSVMGGDGPRSTPTIDRGRVYTLGAKGLLNCLDGGSGKVVWSRNVVEENHADLPMWGMSCSPLMVDDAVVVSSGGPDGHSLVAYHKDSGTPLWRAGSSPASYASPVLATLRGQRQIIMVNAGDVMGHDASTGKILWHFDWPGGEPKVPQAVAVDDRRVLISAGYGLGCKLLEVLPNKGREESIRELWSSRALKPKFSNPVVHDGFIFGLDDGTALTCLDIETGKRQWRGGRYGHGQFLWVGDLLLVQSEAGEMVLVEASGAGQREVGRFQALGEKAWNTPALSGPHLLVRNHEDAACYELPIIGDSSQ